MSTRLTISTEPTGTTAPGAGTDPGATVETRPDVDGRENTVIKVNGDNPNNQPPAEENLILGKFKSQADLEAAYKALEQKLGSNTPPPQNTPPPAAPKPGDLSNVEQAKTELTAKGLDFNKYSKEYLMNGKLSSESYVELAGKGFTAANIDQFIAGQVALSQQNTNEVFASVGGEENFHKLVNFAKTSLTPQEVQAYNDAVVSGNLAQVKMILSGVQSKFDATMGKSGNLHKGGSAPTGPQGEQYAHLDDYYAAVRDPRYQRDASYRRAVDAKLENSPGIWFNIVNA